MLSSDLPKKLGVLIGLIVLSRVGVYIRIPGVDVDAFADTMSNNGVLGYIDALSGGRRTLRASALHAGSHAGCRLACQRKLTMQHAMPLSMSQ
jgi:hypothetical protein